ncbi:hypothetical protein Scep_004057 [Stephania cephalantha]|uniref:Uncharacterized protein n=1 Tax=Stephania cephalantha TaxID=152367 RepID=A0AAP0KRP8_9MAGN
MSLICCKRRKLKTQPPRLYANHTITSTQTPFTAAPSSPAPSPPPSPSSATVIVVVHRDSAATLLLRRRCSPLPPPLLASSATTPRVSSSVTPRIIVASTIATIVDAVVGHCYHTVLCDRCLSPSATPPAACKSTPSIRASLRRCSLYPPPLLASSAAVARLLRARSPPPRAMIAPLAALPLISTRAVSSSTSYTFFRGGREDEFSLQEWIFERMMEMGIYEVFRHYKRMRATDEAFKKKSEQMSTNRNFEMGGSGTGISLHSSGSISARQHGDTLAELTQRLEEMATQTLDTSIDEDAFILRWCQKSRDLEELQRDHQRLQETLLKERMERQEQMQRDKMERQEENREMHDRLARMEALLMQHLGIRPHVPPTPRTPLSPVA